MKCKIVISALRVCSARVGAVELFNAFGFIGVARYIQYSYQIGASECGCVDRKFLCYGEAVVACVCIAYTRNVLIVVELVVAVFIDIDAKGSPCGVFACYV